MYTIAVLRRARVAALLGALVAAPRMAGAQEAATARIEGQIRDSLHSAALAGASVVAVRMAPEPRTFASVYADDHGRFRIDSLAAGRYALSWSSPLLDSLQLAIPEREVVLEPAQHLQVELGTPSAATLRRAACPGLDLVAGQGAVIGTVSDAGTDRPLAGATVVVGWNELAVDKATMRAKSVARTGAAQSDSLGRYRLCGVPTDLTLLLQVQKGGESGGVVDLTVNDSIGMRRQDLSFAREAALPDDPVTSGGSATMVRTGVAGTAIVTGVVRGEQGQPLRDAELRVAGVTGSTRTDSLGRFTLTGMPAGSQMLEARRLGYEMARTPVDLRAGRSVTQDMRLVHVVTLDSIRILAQRTRYPEFERHRKLAGFGHFLDEAAILARRPLQTSDLLRVMPGVRVAHRGFDDVILSSRGGSLRGSCALNVIVDGMPNQDINMVHPSDIAAMEVYPSSIGVPPEYGMSPCGAIVIWTKR